MKNIVLIALLFWSSSNLLSQTIVIEEWRAALTTVINEEVNKQVEKGCLSDSLAHQKFYQNELAYFPIEKALKRVAEISQGLKRREHIVFELFYPIVGFDPETGYNTYIYTKKRWKKIVGETYDSASGKFQAGGTSRKYISKRLKSKSDCYGTGYSFITIFDKDLKIKKIKVGLSLE
ncbi:MAG: hypothetical protein AB8G15_19665 [Saprospiraceae bacterium]